MRRRLSLGIRAVLAGVLAVGLLGLAAPADAQKRGGTLTIVRPTDPVSLDPHTETTAPGAWVYYNILEPLIYLDEKMTIQPRAGHELRGDEPDQGPLQAPAGRQVPRRHALQRGGGQVHVRAGVQEHAARAVGEPRRPDRRRRGRRRPDRGHRHQGALRPDPPDDVDAVRVDRLADRRPEAGRRVPARAGGHRAVQVRRVEDQHARHHRAEPRLLGREGAARPRDLQGGAGGGGADDRAPDRRRRHGHVPVAGPAPDASRRTRSTRCTRRRACGSSTSA